MLENTKKLFLTKMEDEINVFSNFSVILEKALKDGYISQFYNTIKKIFDNEVKYAIEGKLIRINKIKSTGKF